MTTQNFCYWLQGYFELTGTDAFLTDEQSKTIRDKLQSVFVKQTTDRSIPTHCREVSLLSAESPSNQEQFHGALWTTCSLLMSADTHISC